MWSVVPNAPLVIVMFVMFVVNGEPQTGPGRPQTGSGRPQTGPGRPQTGPGRPQMGADGLRWAHLGEGEWRHRIWDIGCGIQDTDNLLCGSIGHWHLRGCCRKGHVCIGKRNSDFKWKNKLARICRLMQDLSKCQCWIL